MSVFIFIAQGPYENYWQYFLPTVPLFVAIIFAIALRIKKKFTKMTQAFEVLKNKYDLMTSIRGASHMLVRIKNKNGTIDYEREYTLELVKNVKVKTTKREHISCEVPINSIPPEAHILESTITNQKLLPIKCVSEEKEISGRKYYHYSWYYRLDKPMTQKGEKIGFRYIITNITKSEEKAFTDEGGVLFVTCGAMEIKINATLIAPPGYFLEIMEYKAIDYNNKERTDLNIPKPSMGTGNEVLNWELPYAHAINYVCKYRCVEKNK